MEIKVTSKILSIPPYISTNWSLVESLEMKDGDLMILLKGEREVRIPQLPLSTIELIFKAHLNYLEQSFIQQTAAKSIPPQVPQMAHDPNDFRIGFASVDSLGNPLQHNPLQANLPDLPSEALEKIRAITKILNPEDNEATPEFVNGCNCLYCQIARTVRDCMIPQTDAKVEEIVAEQELAFEQWIVSQSGEELYQVINKLDKEEHYSVYLGTPIGCTCGKSGCEHILAVLKS